MASANIEITKKFATVESDTDKRKVTINYSKARIRNLGAVPIYITTENDATILANNTQKDGELEIPADKLAYLDLPKSVHAFSHKTASSSSRMSVQQLPD
jgi:3-dehydroquinate synthase class II